METRGVRTRVANACDLCKLRKIKCSGATPCGYCVRRRQPGNCRYTVARRRLRPRPDGVPAAQDHGSSSPLASAPSSRGRPDLSSTPAPSNPVSAAGPTPIVVSLAPSAPSLPSSADRQLPRDTVFAAIEEHEETEVPRDARLLCDAQGKLIFIGDCAPLSFFQTVRRLVTSRVDAHAFAPETSGYSALENVYSRSCASAGHGAEPPPVKLPIASTVSTYFEVTAGLIDLFDHARLVDDISIWADQVRLRERAVDVASAVNYLVLAIGCQKSDEGTAQLYFDYARQLAFASLSGDLGVASVQVFILISFYSLGACQINAAFLFFGIAARAAYSIGIHRAVVNARFAPEIHRQRDRLWKSLRIVDLFLSTSMGRPPATSDLDCTVPYRAQDEAGNEKFDLLNASAQIFLVIEAIVLEVYSRRKISPRLTEGISRELRDWSARWLQRLKDVIEGTSPEDQPGSVNGACHILSSYYYAVILVSRPFLMVELHRRLSDGYSFAAGHGGGLMTGKSKLADACIDAAILMVEPVQGLIERGQMTRRAPVMVSWLFASSLVLGVGLLGGFGRIIEKYCRASIAALEYFAQADAHAVQYSLIAKSLLSTALEYLEKREMQERLQRTESSSQLFGLIPCTPREISGAGRDGRPSRNYQDAAPGRGSPSKSISRPDKARLAHADGPMPRLGFDFESTFLGLTEGFPRTPDFSLVGGSLDADAEQTFGALNLFPLLETDGHIDLGNYF
ncbi:Filamentous growth regulator 27 [Madurella fahalii]|uniref:Filamentous growth regulator 27 n=1 Tax=Madurella fahalii TaxID=1157608 RepID=A0ABQ0GI53_9PEZI